MATYTVNISGTFNATYGYLTINGEKITAKGTKTYTSKPTIKVYVSSSQSSLRSKCDVVLNDAVVKSGSGEYTLSTDATTINIVMLQVEDASTYLYYCAEILTETNTGSEDSGGGEYTRLNYIGTTGTQFIDTGFKPNQNTRVVIDFQADNDACHIFGARTAFLNKGYLVCWNSDFVYSVQVANSHFNGGVFDLRARHTIDMTASEFKLDGVSQATYSVDAFQAEYNLYLASCPNSNESENMQGKIYSCKVYDNGTLVRDFIPCKNASGTVGMWDNVNSVFYANAGTGSFVAGDEYTTMPSTYTRLKYIESTGEQYINTNVIPNINTKVVMKGFSAEKEPAWGVFFGSQTADDSADAYRLRWHGSDNVIACNLGMVGSSNNYRHFWQNYSAGTKLGTVEISKNGMYVDGVKANASSAEVTAISATYPMYIFGVNNAGSLVRPTTMSIARFSIYDNGTLVRDFIPCKTDSGEVGLWDEVNAKFYGNSGSGTFLYVESGGLELAPVGKHNVPVNNVAHAITGGKCLVNGVGYNIIKGRTLVNGTGYDINFKQYATIKIVEHTAIESGYQASKGSYDPYVSLVNSRLNADKIWKSTTLKLEVGTVLYVFAGSNKALITAGWGDKAYGYIRINGVEVGRYSDGSTTRPLYQYVVNGNATINLHGGGLRDVNDIMQSVSWVIIEED